MSTSYYQYQPTGSLPVNVPGKQPQSQHYARHNRNSSGYSQYSVSPPERPESVSTSSGGGVYSSASSQYGGSEYDSTSSGATSVDLLDYMNDRLSQTYNPIPLDKNLARQAQMYDSRFPACENLLLTLCRSGQLNAKNQELLALQAQARARLARTKANFAEGMKAARDVQRDLEWTQKKVQ